MARAPPTARKGAHQDQHRPNSALLRSRMRRNPRRRSSGHHRARRARSSETKRRPSDARPAKYRPLPDRHRNAALDKSRSSRTGTLADQKHMPGNLKSQGPWRVRALSARAEKIAAYPSYPVPWLNDHRLRENVRIETLRGANTAHTRPPEDIARRQTHRRSRSNIMAIPPMQRVCAQPFLSANGSQPHIV